MTLDELQSVVQKDIEETKEYAQFLKSQIKPILTPVGNSHIENMRFFNLGYQFAMEKIDELINNP